MRNLESLGEKRWNILREYLNEALGFADMPRETWGFRSMKAEAMDQEFRSGREAFLTGDHDIAVAHLAACLREGYRVAEVCQDLGQLYYLQGDFRRSVACYRKGIEVGNQNAECVAGIGRCLFEQREYAEAEQVLSKACRVHTAHLPCHLDLAKLYIEIGRYDDAVSVLKRATSLQQDSPAVFHLMGIAHSRSKRYTAAIEALERSITLDPGTTPQPHLLLGECQLALGLVDSAIECFKRSARIYPLAELYYPAARAYQLRQDFATSLQLYEKALTVERNRSRRHEILFQQGEILFEMGEEADRHDEKHDLYAQAATKFEQARGIDPGLTAAGHYVALTRLKQGRFAAALECFERICSSVKEESSIPVAAGKNAELLTEPFLIRVHQGYAQTLNGRFEEGLLSLEQALRLPGGQEETMHKPRILRRMGIVLRELGAHARAVEVWRQLRELDPDNHYQSVEFLQEAEAPGGREGR
jgi:tetratricopeptide (TPR) repeat protein